MKQVNMEANLPVMFFKEGEFFIAYSPALDLSTSGSTFEQVKQRFGEAAKAFFEEAAQHNTLEEALSELGWRKKATKWQPPMAVGHDTENIKVALPA